MSIYYASNKEDITKKALQELFLSVEWESGKYPMSLYKRLKDLIRLLQLGMEISSSV
ncbi:hypothetical protein [Paenibacillus wynnii]|uniref:hypothetical protein n=1 Tax=Paenibacillus wynnii TaxID=268407 RepID=UPI000A9354ED|nr:hypothetical protein [Paenibacillus wynnii]